MKNNIIVICVSGLTSALILSRIQSNLVTIIAKHMPGDYDIEYASPWAGANFLPRFMRNPWYRDYMPDYREPLSTELRTGVDSGCEFDSACIKTAIYLPWLVRAPADIIVNASGFLASRLGGLDDDAVYPIRGHIVLRAAGGGTILSGTYEKGSWESSPNPNTALRITKRCIKLNPEVTK
ncbi:FAD-dependent oxidoreductase-like protein [Fusarium oxysporum Fo47]|uniref:FAD-dependent oxidoreductase-like protein n=1 Tax=Fusarium oxysporum Fo47 TaxID=660027 RepID=UPI002869CB93|nr:FAD-dependent oxidoreductase-like protein [Fusarium oxysporum Fo47]QKD46474.2 FAD-dependent oxidoreductase-like protein [Fusarium oxysporum Fo47]